MDKKRNIYIFYIMALMQGMVFYGPIAALYRQAQGLTIFDITLIESLSLILMIALEAPWGYIADRIGYRRTIVICSVLYFISKVIFWRADGFALFLTERLILSVVLAGMSGCDMAYLYLSAGQRDSHKVFSIYSSMSTMGLLFAAVVFSSFAISDYRLTALLTMIPYGAATLLSFFLVEVKPKEAVRQPIVEQIKLIGASIGENKSFILFLIAGALMAEANQTITVFLNQLQYLRSGIPARYFGFIYVLVTLTGLAAAFSSRLSKLLGEKAYTRLLFIGAIASCTIMAFSANPIAAVAGVMLLRVASAMFEPVKMEIQNRNVSISDRATMLSVYSVIVNITAVGTNLIFGRIADIDVKYAMLAGAVFCSIGFILYSIWHSMNIKGRECKN